MKNIVITGGAGFIGSHVVRLFVNKYPEYHIINLDKLTYAGNLANLKDVENKPNYEFIRMDICILRMFINFSRISISMVSSILQQKVTWIGVLKTRLPLLKLMF